MTEKEKIRQQILQCNSNFGIEQFDFSIFGDNDPDVFAKQVSFDDHEKKYYINLSPTLKNNKQIVIQAAKHHFNIPFIPEHFFNHKEVLLSILYARQEKNIPEKFLTKESINYMFEFCARSSMELKPFIEQYLEKETIIRTLKEQNEFFSNSYKEGAYPCIDRIYIPKRMYNDYEIVKNLFISHFDTVSENSLVTKNMICDLLQTDFVITELPESLITDYEFVKQCLEKDYNYRIVESSTLNQLINNNEEKIKELIKINPNILKISEFKITFNIFLEFLNQDIKNIHYCKNISERDKKQLYDFITSEKMLDYFKKPDSTYDFSLLYDIHNYYRIPIIDNRFIIEKIAEQDKTLFSHISEKIAEDDQFMHKLFFHHNVEYDHENESCEAMFYKIQKFGSFEKYLNFLYLNQNIQPTNKKSKIKI